MWQEPIFDRTNADTLTARAGQSNIDNHKGALNYQDLNRIEGNFQYIVDQLYKNAFIIPYKKRCFEEIAVRRVPRVKYKIVDFLESTGEQCFDADIVPNQDTRVVIDFEGVGISSNVALFGARTGTASNVFAMWLASNEINPQYGNVAYNTNTIALDCNTRLIYDMNCNTTTVGGTSVSFTKEAFSSGCTLHLLTVNVAGTVDSRMTPGKLYSSQIYSNAVLVRDLIPVLDENDIPCLYDKISDIFLYNMGTGFLTYGTILETVYSDTQTDLVTEKTSYTDWQERNIPWRSEIERIRDNYNNLVKIFLRGIGLPILYSSQFLLYDEVNDWERIALEGKRLADNLEAEYIYCGTIDSGGDRLL